MLFSADFNRGRVNADRGAIRPNNQTTEQAQNGHHLGADENNQHPENNAQVAARINIRVVIQREVIWRLILMLVFNAFRILLVLMFFGGLESIERFKLISLVLIAYFILKHIIPLIIGNRITNFFNSGNLYVDLILNNVNTYCLESDIVLWKKLHLVLNYLGVIGHLVVNTPPNRPNQQNPNGYNRMIAIVVGMYNRCVVMIKLTCRVIISFAATLVPNLIPLLQQEQLNNLNQQQNNDINLDPVDNQHTTAPFEQMATNPYAELNNPAALPDTNDSVQIIDDTTIADATTDVFVNEKPSTSSTVPSVSQTQSHSNTEDTLKDTIIL